MKHKHIGPPDVACTGCFGEAQSRIDSEERWKTVGGIVLLITLVIGGMLALSWYLSKHQSHLGECRRLHTTRATIIPRVDPRGGFMRTDRSQVFCPQCGFHDTFIEPPGTQFDCDCKLRTFSLPTHLSLEQVKSVRGRDLHEAYRNLARAANGCGCEGRPQRGACLDCSARWTAVSIDFTRADLALQLKEFVDAKRETLTMPAVILGELEAMAKVWANAGE